MLSICITVKNRSKVCVRDDKVLYLFPHCLGSIAKSLTFADDCEIVIADWESTDWPIKEWIKTDRIPIHLLTLQSDKGFSRGKGLNIAAKYALGDKLLFLDADMIVNYDVMHKGISITTPGKAYYPTINYEVNESGKQIIHEGGGNLFITKEDFNKTDGWPEYWNYGFEDVDFVTKVKSVAEIITSSNYQMFHQWHPDTIKKIYDSKEEDKIIEVEKRKKHFTKKENEPVKILEKLTKIYCNDPNTTHKTLKIAKGEWR